MNRPNLTEEQKKKFKGSGLSLCIYKNKRDNKTDYFSGAICCEFTITFQYSLPENVCPQMYQDNSIHVHGNCLRPGQLQIHFIAIRHYDPYLYRFHLVGKTSNDYPYSSKRQAYHRARYWGICTYTSMLFYKVRNVVEIGAILGGGAAC